MIWHLAIIFYFVPMQFALFGFPLLLRYIHGTRPSAGCVVLCVLFWPIALPFLLFSAFIAPILHMGRG